ncbi:MAG: M20 family metallopeptidase, partial [Bryobacteraceae bacterium]|nr:M20 family metallopeptidase [Bryobacteraceae bacterium]
SEDAAAVTRFMELLAEEARDCASARLVRMPQAGRCLLLRFDLPGPRRKAQPGLLAVGQGDTVWPTGTLRSMPWRETPERLHGPGVLDMKAGLAFFLFAMRLLRKMDVPVRRNVDLWVVSDEETGSHDSRPHTEKLARASSAVLVLEPGTGPEGRLKTARKGVGLWKVRVHGRKAHAGVDFAAGANAIVELARQIGKIASFTDLSKGLTVNPGIVQGGTRTNVVPDLAEVEVDVRVARLRDAAALERKFRALRPFDRRCRVEVEGGLNRPPMERTRAIAALFRTAQRIAREELGFELEESSTGGGSDGNFTAALGVPTLDGLGAVGEGAHAPHESILQAPSPARIALLACLVRHLGQ